MRNFTPQKYYRIQDPGSKTKKVIKACVKEILLVVAERINKPINQLTVLDVGCGSGEYVFELEKHFKKVIGVEPYKPKYDEALISRKNLGSKAVFYNELIENLKIKEKIDVVVSLTTIEHMPNQERSFKNIFNLLNHGGVVYLTCPNKYWPIEQHYKLPFLSWLPIGIANRYVKLFRLADDYIDCSYSRSYLGMQKLFKLFPCNFEFILPKDPNNAYIGCTESSTFYKFIKDFGIKLIDRFSVFWFLSKGFIIVATKR